MILLAKIKNLDGAPQQRQEVYWYKRNISNPKVNRRCPPLTANRISANCTNVTWTLNAMYSTEGLPYGGIQRYDCGLRMRRECRERFPV